MVSSDGGRPPVPPGDSPSPTPPGDGDGLDARIDARLEQFLNQLTGGKPLDEMLGGFVQQAAQQTLTLARPLIEESMAQGQRVIEARVGEMLSQYQAQVTPSHSPTEQPVSGVPNDATTIGKRLLHDLTLKEVTETIFGAIDRFQAARDPLTAFERLAATRPAMAQFIGQQLAPDPLVNQLPGIIAQNSLETARAVTRELTRGRKGGKGKSAYNPFLWPDEDTEDGEEALPDETTSNPNSETITLHRRRSRNRNLREIA